MLACGTVQILSLKMEFLNYLLFCLDRQVILKSTEKLNLSVNSLKISIFFLSNKCFTGFELTGQKYCLVSSHPIFVFIILYGYLDEIIMYIKFIGYIVGAEHILK